MSVSNSLRIWFAAALLIGVISGQAVRAQDKQPTTPAEYRIVARDILQIDVWRYPEITRTISVRPDGTILLPLIDDVKASGLTAMQLAALVRQKLGRKIPNPQVTVTVCQVHGPNFLPSKFVPAKPLLLEMPQLRDVPAPEVLPTSRVVREG